MGEKGGPLTFEMGRPLCNVWYIDVTRLITSIDSCDQSTLPDLDLQMFCLTLKVIKPELILCLAKYLHSICKTLFLLGHNLFYLQKLGQLRELGSVHYLSC